MLAGRTPPARSCAARSTIRTRHCRTPWQRWRGASARRFWPSRPRICAAGALADRAGRRPRRAAARRVLPGRPRPRRRAAARRAPDVEGALPPGSRRHPEVPQVVLDGERRLDRPRRRRRGGAARHARTHRHRAGRGTPRPPPGRALARRLAPCRRRGARGAARRAVGGAGRRSRVTRSRGAGGRAAAGATLYAGNSLAIRDLDWFWPAAAPPVRVLANRGANGIDGFVSSVLGAAAGAAGSDGRPVRRPLRSCTTSAACSLRTATVVRAIFVVLDNDGGGIFDHLPIAAFPERPRASSSSRRTASTSARWSRRTALASTRVTESPVAGVRGARGVCAPTEPPCSPCPIDRGHSLAAHRRAWTRAAAVLEAST